MISKSRELTIEQTNGHRLSKSSIYNIWRCVACGNEFSDQQIRFLSPTARLNQCLLHQLQSTQNAANS